MLIVRSVLSGLACVAFAFVLMAPSCQSAKDATPSLGKREQADALIQKAGERFAAGDFQGNVRSLKEAATIDPTNPKVWWKLCEGYQLTDELNLALDACQHNIELDPAGISYNSLGLVYQAQKDYSRASQAFEKAVADSPDDPSFNQNLAWALLWSKQYEKAVLPAQRLIRVSSNSPTELTLGYEILGVACDKLGQTDRAREAFKKANLGSCELGTDAKGDPSINCHQ
jgi:Flp pilus assembly protein TadD